MAFTITKFDSKHPIASTGDFIEITARRCSDKVSPLTKVGERFVVLSCSYMNNANKTIQVVVRHPKRKKAELRINADRFDWKLITIDELKEEYFKQEMADDTQKLINKFSFEEHMQMSFVPMIITHIVWHYADMVLAQAAANRIIMFKKAGREVKYVKQRYEEECRKDLDYNHLKSIGEETNRFLQECSYHFEILWFSVNKAFKKSMPEYPYSEMRTNAIIAILLIRFLYEHNKAMDKLIAQKLGGAKNSIRNQWTDKLYTLMEAYAGELGKFDYQDKDINLCMSVFQNNINKIQFNIVND